MNQEFVEETWRQLRREARRFADEAAGKEAERCTRRTLAEADWQLLARIERQLELLNESWAVHERPLLSRLPVVGGLLSWLGSRLARFLLQHQVAFDAESARLLQELYQVQRLLAREQIARTDDLFARLEETVLALEARVRDLEGEVERLRRRQECP